MQTVNTKKIVWFEFLSMTDENLTIIICYNETRRV